METTPLQASAIYLTNVPVASLSFGGAADEIAVALESPHVLVVRLARRTSQSYTMEQDHRLTIRFCSYRGEEIVGRIVE